MNRDVLNPNEEIVKITCWRMERAGKGDMIGKVEVPVQTLSDQKQHEQWYPLAGADASEYIAGEVRLKLEYKKEEQLLLAQVVSAKNLAPKGIGGTSNPYVRVQLGRRKKKTKVVNRTLTPTFNEIFEFKVKPDGTDELVVVLMHRDKLNSVFMGRFAVPFMELEPNYLYDGWYVVTANGVEDTEEDEYSSGVDTPPVNESPTTRRRDTIEHLPAGWQLGPHRNRQGGDIPRVESATDISSLAELARRRGAERSNSTVSLQDRRKVLSSSSETGLSSERKPVSLGDIRMVLKYTQEMVLPSVEYTELLELMMEDKFAVLRALGSVTTEKEDVGRCLSQIFEAKGKAEELIICLTCEEVAHTNDPDVLFRANSLATKTFDYYLKLVALPYLRNTLEETIKEIYVTKKSCEVDPTRLEKSEDLPRNFANLHGFAEEICSRIFQSLEQCPK
jgi:hypothetical protein